MTSHARPPAPGAGALEHVGLFAESRSALAAAVAREVEAAVSRGAQVTVAVSAPLRALVRGALSSEHAGGSGLRSPSAGPAEGSDRSAAQGDTGPHGALTLARPSGPADDRPLSAAPEQARPWHDDAQSDAMESASHELFDSEAPDMLTRARGAAWGVAASSDPSPIRFGSWFTQASAPGGPGTGHPLPLDPGAAGGRHASVRFADRADFYDAPGRTIAALHRLALRHRPHEVVFIGEPVLPRDRPHERAHWLRLESELADALSPDRLRVVCAHDLSELEPGTQQAVLAAHPSLVSADEAADRTGAVPWAPPDPGPPEGAEVFQMPLSADLARVREDAAVLASDAGLPADRRADLVIAVNELAANVMEHGAGEGTVALWHDADRLVCEVHDPSAELDDPRVGLRPADVLGDRGYGLWITRQVCDFFELLPAPDGTRVRLYFRMA